MRFIRGEVRNIDFEIISCEDDNFEISTAHVELVHRDEVIQTIPTITHQHSISFMLDTTNLEHSFYKIIITFSIGSEVIKRVKEIDIDDAYI